MCLAKILAKLASLNIMCAKLAYKAILFIKALVYNFAHKDIFLKVLVFVLDANFHAILVLKINAFNVKALLIYIRLHVFFNAHHKCLINKADIVHNV